MSYFTLAKVVSHGAAELPALRGRSTAEPFNRQARGSIFATEAFGSPEPKVIFIQIPLCIDRQSRGDISSGTLSEPTIASSAVYFFIIEDL